LPNNIQFGSLTVRETAKVGNLIHYIAKKSGEIYLTRLLKILYLIDEKSVQEIGVPVTPFEYRVAENGPMIVELWHDLKSKNSFSHFISVDFSAQYEGYRIKAKSTNDTNLNRFSEYELELIDEILMKYRDYSTEELIEFIHEKESSLWKDIVYKKSINFNSDKISKHIVDLRKHIEHDETLSEFYDMYRNTRY